MEKTRAAPSTIPAAKLAFTSGNSQKVWYP